MVRDTVRLGGGIAKRLRVCTDVCSPHSCAQPRPSTAHGSRRLPPGDPVGMIGLICGIQIAVATFDSGTGNLQINAMGHSELWQRLVSTGGETQETCPSPHTQINKSFLSGETNCKKIQKARGRLPTWVSALGHGDGVSAALQCKIARGSRGRLGWAPPK